MCLLHGQTYPCPCPECRRELSPDEEAAVREMRRQQVIARGADDGEAGRSPSEASAEYLEGYMRGRDRLRDRLARERNYAVPCPCCGRSG